MQATDVRSTRTRATRTPPAAERQYTAAEVAELWSCSRSHIYNLIARGELRTTDLAPKRQRTKTRIPESALAEFIKRQSR